MTRVSKAAQGTQFLWAAPPDHFIFIDADLNPQKPINAAPGSVTPSGSVSKASASKTTTGSSRRIIVPITGGLYTLLKWCLWMNRRLPDNTPAGTGLCSFANRPRQRRGTKQLRLDQKVAKGPFSWEAIGRIPNIDIND
jgi:hypothetical protein